MPRVSASNQTEQIQRILNPKSLYYDNDVDDLMSKITSSHPDIHYISPVIAQIPDQFKQSLQGFMKDVNKQRLAIIFCKDGHFTTIYTKKPNRDDLQDPWEVSYLDPAINSDLDQRLRIIMRDEMSSYTANPFSEREIKLLVSGVTLQSVTLNPISDEVSEVLIGNSHCGPFIIAFLDGVINGEITHVNHASGEDAPFHLECKGVEISGLSKINSDQCGAKLRRVQAGILQGLSGEKQKSQTDILKEFLEKEQGRGRVENSASSNSKKPGSSLKARIFQKLGWKKDRDKLPPL